MRNAGRVQYTVGSRGTAWSLVLLLLAADAVAARIDFKVSHDGQPLPGAEICFFAMSAREPGIINRLFHSGDVVCLPADNVLELPTGDWLYFARHASGFISDYLPQVSMPSNAPADAYKVVQEDVVAAGTIRVHDLLTSLQSDERLVILTEGSLAGTIILPLVKGEATFLAPAEAKFVIAIVKDHRPIRMSPVMKVAANRTLDVRPWPEPRPSVHDVIAWISFPALLRDTFGVAADQLDPPDVQLEVNGESFLPIFKTNTPALAETLQLFKEVPRAPADIRLGGPLWMPDTIRSGGSAAVEVLEDPLTTEPAGAIRAAITLPPQHSPLSCGALVTAPSAQVLSCTSSADEGCETLQTVVVRENGEIEFGGLRAGRYVVVFDAAIGGTPLRHPVQVDVGTATTLAIDPEYYSFYGTVLLGDQPVSRELSFLGRSTTLSDANGRYAVTLPGASPPPPAAVIRVTNCDNESDVYMHVTRSAPKRGERFDIVIPNNSVRGKLFASGSRERIAGWVRLVAFEDDSSDHAHFAGKFPAEASLDVTIRHIVTSTAITLCGEADGYETQCLPRFRMGDAENREVEIELREIEQFQGRVAVPSPIELGRLWFVNDQGAVTESVPVQRDGGFAFRLAHTAREYVVIASSTLPLAVLPWPSTVAGAAVELAYPVGRRRDVIVHLIAPGSASRLSMLGLTLGEAVIPTEGFAYHQRFHGANYVVANGERLQISDVLESAPISVVLGPDPLRDVGQFPTEVDWMSVISYVRSRPRLPVDSSGVVTFGR